MQARVKAGWISEADLAPQGRGSRRRAGAGAGRAASLTGACTREDAGRRCGGRRRTRFRCRAARRAAAPERLCIATRTVKPIDEMIRFVVGPEGGVVPDVKRRLPGRGVWVTATRAAVGAAMAATPSPAASSGRSRAAADLLRRPTHLLDRAALDALAIARKAGLVAAGLRQGRGGARAAGGRGTACRRMRPRTGPGSSRRPPRSRPARTGAPPVMMFTSAQLDLALGRSNVIHAALLAGPATEVFLARCRRLELSRRRACRTRRRRARYTRGGQLLGFGPWLAANPRTADIGLSRTGLGSRASCGVARRNGSRMCETKNPGEKTLSVIRPRR